MSFINGRFDSKYALFRARWHFAISFFSGRVALLLTVAWGLGMLVPTTVFGAFPGSPGLIALQRSADPDASDIWLLDWQTGFARRLTHRGYNAEPAFSPNGQWVAFRSDASWHAYLNIWAIRTDGTGLHRLTKGKGDLDDESPAFSANGRWVAFFVEHPGRDTTEVDRVALRGGHRQVLVSPGRRGYAVDPSYSPDGRHLAWVQGIEAPKAEAHIYIGDTLGRQARRLTNGIEPEFSPNGRSIVFVRRGWCAQGVAGTEIDTLSLETGTEWHVKASCGSFLDAPTYSPDGTWIAYTVYSGRRSELGFAQVPLSTPSFAPLSGLGTDLAVDEAPSWQPVP